MDSESEGEGVMRESKVDNGGWAVVSQMDGRAQQQTNHFSDTQRPADQKPQEP